MSIKKIKRIAQITALASVSFACSMGANTGASHSDVTPAATTIKVVPNYATPAQVAINKAVIKRYVEAMGKPGFEKILNELQASNHKLLRHEFENLKYNAAGSELADVAQPDDIAIADRVNTIERFIGDGDRVAVRLNVKGTHKGNLYGLAATGKRFDIAEIAIFKLDNGKIVESWFLAEEARLLRQLETPFPRRKDGKIILPPVYDDTIEFDQGLAAIMENPEDTPEYRHKKLLLAYKSKVKPDDYKFEGRPYSVRVRGGIDNMVERGAELNVEGSHLQAISQRNDTIALTMAEGDHGMFLFRLNALNSGDSYGIPASNKMVHDWELGFADFEGDHWVNGWYISDELGYLLTLGSEEALNFLVSPKKD
jgi:predicted ester cyclase